MKYQLHDFDPKLWAWIKAQATIAQITINEFITRVLIIEQTRHKEREKRSIIAQHQVEKPADRKHVRDYVATKEA